MRKAISAAASVSFALLLLAGCSSSNPTYGPAATNGTGTSTSGAELSVASSTLGEIVVNDKGMTVYAFDKDTQGTNKSACDGACADLWPAVTTQSNSPSMDGVTGTVGTIDAIGGGKQVTLNGWPLYTYAKDSGAGDVTGQGVQGIWWVVDPSGQKITKMPSTGGY